jgi:hypothetical protein
MADNISDRNVMQVASMKGDANNGTLKPHVLHMVITTTTTPSYRTICQPGSDLVPRAHNVIPTWKIHLKYN